MGRVTVPGSWERLHCAWIVHRPILKRSTQFKRTGEFSQGPSPSDDSPLGSSRRKCGNEDLTPRRQAAGAQRIQKTGWSLQFEVYRLVRFFFAALRLCVLALNFQNSPCDPAPVCSQKNPPATAIPPDWPRQEIYDPFCLVWSPNRILAAFPPVQ